MRKPDFFIVGAPKTGTTAIYHYLKRHPQIFLPDIKEPCFFATDIKGEYGQIKELKKYETLYNRKNSMPNMLSGDCSTIYLMSERAIPRILEYNPFAKIIAILRNPVEMALSMHNQALKVAEEEIQDFRIAWDLQENRARGFNIPTTTQRAENLQYKKVCSIGTQMQRLKAVVPEQQLLTLFHEDMRGDMRAEYIKILKFLNLNDDGQIIFPIHNESQTIRSLKVQKILKNPPKILIFLRPFLHKIRFHPLRAVAKLNKKNVKKIGPDKNTLEFLSKEFFVEIKILEEMFQKDLSHWLSNEKSA